MVSLLLIADDFTGALDTGIQFAGCGASTKVLTLSGIDRTILSDRQIEVLIVDSESRHLSREEAYRRVYAMVKEAVDVGVPYIYKKTDSGLRGNIGAELAAVLDASGEKFLPFIPALPAMNRVTVKGIQYIDEVPIHLSEFGQDPYDSVKSSRVSDLFANEDMAIRLFSKTDEYWTSFLEKTIGIFDATSQQDIERIAQHLKANNQLRIMAGCAGFASVLANCLQIDRCKAACTTLGMPLLIACGSMNPITRRQIEYGERQGYARIVMSPEQMLDKDYFMSEEGWEWLKEIQKTLDQNRVVMIDTGISEPALVEKYRKKHAVTAKQTRIMIADRMGYLLSSLMRKNAHRALMIIGGDTLMGFITHSQCQEIEPICELEQGTVLSLASVDDVKIWLVTKSGGFGEESLIQSVADQISRS